MSADLDGFYRRLNVALGIEDDDEPDTWGELAHRLASVAAPSEPTREADEACNCPQMDALEVLCRVFDDGADVAHDEWLAWYKPAKWLHPSRALGAFIRRRLAASRAEPSVAAPSEPTKPFTQHDVECLRDYLHLTTDGTPGRAHLERIIANVEALSRGEPVRPDAGEAKLMPCETCGWIQSLDGTSATCVRCLKAKLSRPDAGEAARLREALAVAEKLASSLSRGIATRDVGTCERCGRNTSSGMHPFCHRCCGGVAAELCYLLAAVPRSGGEPTTPLKYADLDNLALVLAYKHALLANESLEDEHTLRGLIVQRMRGEDASAEDTELLDWLIAECRDRCVCLEGAPSAGTRRDFQWYVHLNGIGALAWTNDARATLREAKRLRSASPSGATTEVDRG